MNDIIRDHFPRFHFARPNLPGVRKQRPTNTQSYYERRVQPIRAYAVMVGTPAAETRDVNATGDGRIVQSRKEPTAQMIITALRGCPSLDTREIHHAQGKTPSRAIAKISRDAAMTATEVFYVNL